MNFCSRVIPYHVEASCTIVTLLPQDEVGGVTNIFV